MERKFACRYSGIGILILFLGIYIGLQSYSIYGGDAGELASAIIVSGIAHPPGYPLYTLLGINLLHLIPSGTFAWKIGFLSSVPAALTLFVFFHLLCRLGNRPYLSLVAVTILGLTYPFWLYAVTVEVFALNNLFTILLLYLLVRWYEEGKRKWLFLFSFILGLSFTHHHIIVFLFPALAFLLWQKRQEFAKQNNTRNLLYSVGLFFTGLLPYLYVFFAAKTNPPINWQGEGTLVNLFRLIIRADYGTFKAGPFISYHPVLRLSNLYSFFDFLYKDFRLLGIILFVMGIYGLSKKNRTMFFTLGIGCLSYLFFLFYASFPLAGNFLVATFERFILPLYLFFTFFIAFGMLTSIDLLNRLFIKKLKRTANFLITGVMALFLIYPLSLAVINFEKVSIIRNDFTAENLGQDIFSSLLPGSILFISSDTPLFDTQYVYYAEKKWPEVKLIHFAKLYTPYYRGQLQKYYPLLTWPEKIKEESDIFADLIEANYSSFPIYSKASFDIPGFTFVPMGLLYRCYKNEDVPQGKEVIEQNRKLWAAYHDPLLGSLGKYQNLMLSDVLTAYGIARQEFAYYAIKNKRLEIAEENLLAAEKIIPEDLDSYIFLAQVYILQDKCQKAEDQIESALIKDNSLISGYYLQVLNYASCFHDQEKASYYQKIYEEKSRAQETPLKKL